MSIPYRVQDYLAEHDIPWYPVAHSPSHCSTESAQFSGIPPDQVAKAVLLEDDAGYVMAVIAANRRLDLHRLDEALHRDLSLAREDELPTLFSDCSLGAVPPVGEVYGIPTVWDETLGDKTDVYFEAGDHRTLVHLDGGYFCELMRSARKLGFS